MSFRVIALAVIIAGCSGEGTTSSGGGAAFAAKAAAYTAAGYMTGRWLGEELHETDLPTEVPLTEIDRQAIALAGGVDGFWLRPCTRIWRHTGDGSDFEKGGKYSGGVAWLSVDNSCSIGPRVTDDPVKIARKLLHEAGHIACKCRSEPRANGYEQRASAALGIA